MNLDQLNSVPAWHTLQTAYAGIDGMQSSPAPMRVMAAAVLFNELCWELRLDPSEMLDKARRVACHAEQHLSNELKALRLYIRNETQ